MKIIENVKEYDEILSNNTSVVVDFYADWCGPCKMVGPVFEEVSKENTDVVFVKVNVDANGDIAQRYGVMSIPTLISFKNGNEVKKVVGFQPKPALQDLANSSK